MSQVVTSENESVHLSGRDEAAVRLQQAAQVFPLPLTPFERYMLVDDRAGYPMTYAHVVDLHGKIDQPAMESAVLAALARHPLTCAKVRQRGDVEHWIAGSLPRQAVIWHEQPPVRLPFGGRWVDLYDECGFRIDGYAEGENSYLVFSTHHAVTDGLGLLQFVGEVLAIYGGLTASCPEVPKLIELEPSRLSGRGEFEVSIPHPVSRITALRSLISETWKIISRQPTLMADREDVEHSKCVRSGYVVVSVDDDRLVPVRKWVTEKGASLNDLLIRDLIVALDEWTSQQKRGRSRWLRVAMPTSLRSKYDRRTPAANILGYAFVTRSRNDCRDESALLDGIVQELDFVQEWSLGTMFSAAVGVVDRIPGLLRLITRRKRRFATAVLSNLGEVTRRFTAKLPRENGKVMAGNLELVNITAAPPVRPGTSLAMAVTGCSGKLNFCAQFDTQVISEGEVRTFLESYVQKVLSAGANTSQQSVGLHADRMGR